MVISKSTLDRWSKQGAVETPKRLREKIEKKLTEHNSTIQYKKQLDIYLQGSYRNSTNIYGNSDVDIVVQNNGTFFNDISELNAFETELYKNAFEVATYTWRDFKSEVIETIEDGFGKSNVEIGNKSIKIDADNYEADIVPCFEYRKYVSFGISEEDRECIPGIKFYTTDENRPVINYPKEHYSKGAKKNHRTNNYYKPTIRIFKNIKTKLIEKYIITKEQAPSYFLENLMYNVPDYLFNEKDVQNRILGILKWLNENIDSLSNFVCQNNQNYLFGHSQEQWEESNAKLFI